MLGLVLALPAAADAPAEEGDPAVATAQEPGPSEDDDQIEALRVAGEEMDPVGVVEPSESELPVIALEDGRAFDLGEGLRSIPGINGVKRSAGSSEPVIRGMGWERVQTRLDGMSLYGAGPGRMDPPVVMLGPGAIRGLEVVKSLPSALLGPGGTGGSIQVSPYYRPGEGDPETWGGRVQTTYDSAGHGFFGLLEGMGSTERVDLYGSFHGRRAGDYESGDGTTVPAGLTGFGGSLSLDARPTEEQRVSLSFVDSERRDEDFPSLPLDSEFVSVRTGNAAWSIAPGERWLDSFELRAGYSGAEHGMTNQRKPSRSMMQVKTDADAGSFGSRALGRWELSPALGLAAGVDFTHLDRDATRIRQMNMPMPMSFTDRIWPNVRQWNLGGAAELDLGLGESWTLRLGGRVDGGESDALAADAASLGGRTVRENYVFFYGPEAAQVDRSFVVGGANLRAEWWPTESLRARLGTGLTSRAPNTTELYFAFAPAPGGFLVGNPSLDPEKKIEIAGSLNWSTSHADLEVAAFYAGWRDYVLPTLIARMDVNGDGTDDDVRGFVNVDARSYGAEARLLLSAWDHWSLPLDFMWVRGQNTSGDRPLPQIPPIEGRAALRFDSHGERFPWWAQFGGRFVAAQTRLDPAFGENQSASFYTLHVRGGVELLPGLDLQLGLENLLDRNYSEFLTLPSFFTQGELEAGEDIPAPGRHVYVTLRWAF
jgi:iron complex outermembrane receptor protein